MLAVRDKGSRRNPQESCACLQKHDSTCSVGRGSGGGEELFELMTELSRECAEAPLIFFLGVLWPQCWSVCRQRYFVLA